MLTLRRRAIPVLGLLLMAALAGPAAPAQASPAEIQTPAAEEVPLFGVNFVPPEEPLMSMAWDAGARIARIQINWQDIERSPGTYGWDYVDGLVDPLVRRGFAIHAVLTLPPDFRRASDDGYMPANTNLPWNHPSNYWAQWVGAVAAHFRGRIQSYEIWNEPDLDIYWNGTPGEYFQLLRTAYPAIKASDPNATVVMAGMAIFLERDFLPEVLRNVATNPSSPANNYYFDALSIHLYTDPDLLYQELTNVKGWLLRYDLSDKPIWLTETGVPLPAEDPRTLTPAQATLGFGTEEEAGWFILQGFANALAAGVERIMVYRLQDTPQPIEPIRYGLLRVDASERPAYAAFRVATTYLAAGGEATRSVVNGATIVQFARPQGGRLTVLWANEPRETTVPLDALHPRATLVDWTGRTTRVEAEDEVYRLDLAPATNDRIGGPPLMLVEEDGLAPQVFVAQLPDHISAGTELPLSWSGDDGEFGTGVVGFDVQVSHNGGPWLSWLANTARTDAVYDVTAGGLFKFRVRARDGAGNVSDFALANPLGTRAPAAILGQNLGANVTSLPPLEGDGDPFFGANFVPPDEPWIDLAWEAGVRSARLQINWQDIERSPDHYTWDYTDSLVLPLVEQGYEITAILTLPPEFRRANPEAGGFMPSALYLLWDDPNNHWGHWVHEVAVHYEGQIAAYEIWNEPDLDIYWDGTAADYAELLRSAYQAIKAADPDATVVFGGLARREDLPFLSETLDYISEDEQGPANNYFFDVLALHIYSETNLIYDEIAEGRALLDGYGMGDKPIWITETNVPIWGEASGPDAWESGYADLEEASWFMVQAMATARAAGAERVMVYRFNDVGEPIAYGLLRPDRSERPSYTAYQVAATFMADVVSAEREQTPEATIIQLEKENGGQVRVMWANTGVPARITVESSAPAGLFANADGAVWPAEPRDDGSYIMELDYATNRDLSRNDTFFFGGPPILLVEDDRTPPVVTIDPLESVARRDRVTVRWSADDGELGTGVATYDVQVSTDEGGWSTLLEETPLTETEYDTSQGGSLNFRVRARDRAGNASPYVETGPVLVNGILVAEVLNVRGEPVAGAEIGLPSRRTYTTGPDGTVRITDLDEGEHTINYVDGGDQGTLFPPPVVTHIGEETHVTWVLLPRTNQVPNGSFGSGLTGWIHTSNVEEDVSTVTVDGNPILQLAGQRRAWGAPSASVSFDVPPRLESPVLSFQYRLPTEGQKLSVTVIARDESGQPAVLTRLWQSEGPTNTWERVWFDATPFLGKQVTLIFALEGPKNAPAGLVQIDDVALGSLPEQ